MGGQYPAVRSIVAGHVGDDRDLSFGLGHHVLQHRLALVNALVNAFAGGAAYVQAVDALFDEITGQFLHPLRGNGPLVVVTGVKRRDHAAVFLQIAHYNDPSLIGYCTTFIIKMQVLKHVSPRLSPSPRPS